MIIHTLLIVQLSKMLAGRRLSVSLLENRSLACSWPFHSIAHTCHFLCGKHFRLWCAESISFLFSFIQFARLCYVCYSIISIIFSFILFSLLFLITFIFPFHFILLCFWLCCSDPTSPQPQLIGFSLFSLTFRLLEQNSISLCFPSRGLWSWFRLWRLQPQEKSWR